MNSRNIIILLIGAALLAVCALCGLTGIGTVQWMRTNNFNFRFSNMSVPAEVGENITFDVKQPLTLEVNNGAGAIEVIAYDGDQVIVDLVKKAWASNEEDAQVAAEAIKVDAEQSADKLTLTYSSTDEPNTMTLGTYRSSIVNFTIKVPRQTATILHTNMGSVSVNGTQGSARIFSRFGEITVSNLKGPLTIDGSHGSVKVSNIAAGTGGIQIETRFGAITAKTVSGGEIQFTTSHGELAVNDLAASGSLEVENQFGKTELKEVEAQSVNVKNTNGDLILINVRMDGELEAITNFGGVRVEDTDASSYLLETNNGSVQLNGVQGKIEITNRFGDITIDNAKQAILDLETSNGKVVFTGDLDPNSSHSIQNNFGDVTLTIPEDSAFNLKLKTQMGKIVSELPVTIGGELSEAEWQAKLNGGGSDLKVTTQNGNIYLKSLDQ